MDAFRDAFIAYEYLINLDLSLTEDRPAQNMPVITLHPRASGVAICEGTIPPELGQLKALKVLKLNGGFGGYGGLRGKLFVTSSSIGRVYL